MKLHFNKLETTNDTIQVSWDGGNTWNSFPVDSAKENGITFSETDCPNISLIKVKGKFTTISNLDFVATAKGGNSTSGGLEGLSPIDENGVFTGFTGNVIIPEGVTSIGGWAFQGCSNLATINFTGTEAQWNAITKGSGWNDYVPSTCVINYNYKSE